MSESLARTVQILRSEARSHADLDFLASQLTALNDLRQYIYDLTDAKKWKLLAAFKVEIYEEGDTVFVKGDPSNKLYVILSGKVDMLDTEATKSDIPRTVLIATLSTGKMIGERGLVRRTMRMLTACAQTHCVLLTLDQTNFAEVLETAIWTRMEEKLKFIDKYIPCTKPLPVALKERLSYALNMQYASRGKVLGWAGEELDALYFVCSGECVVSESGQHEGKQVVKLGAGCWFGEESVLLGLRSHYDVYVSSECAWVYSLTRENALKLLPDATMETMKAQYLVKRETRKLIASHVRKLPAKINPSPSVYSLASPAAKRLLIRNQRHEHKSEDIRRDGENIELKRRLRAKREMGPSLSMSGTSSLNLNWIRSGASTSRLALPRLF